jgi:NAD+ kinase
VKWAIVGKGDIIHVVEQARWVVKHLRSIGEEPLVESGLAEALGEPGVAITDMDQDADLFVPVGGDGTILWTLQHTDKPVFGINVGAIGFMAEVEPPQTKDAIQAILGGAYRIEERNKLAAYLDGERLPDAANELTLQTRRIAKLIRFTVHVDGEVLDTYRGDGIIVSTATGSTGYAMSVGGPLVHPRVNGTILAPIAPFRLAARPWVVPSDATIDLTLLERDSAQGVQQAKVVVDGQHGFDVATGATVHITPSERKARFIRLGSGVYERVRTKLTR